MGFKEVPLVSGGSTRHQESLRDGYGDSDEFQGFKMFQGVPGRLKGVEGYLK